MPVKIPDALPATRVLAEENIFVMTEKRSLSQDIRPLKIAIVNLMPTKEKTETQLLRLISNSPLQVEITLPRLVSSDPAVRRRFDRYLGALRAHEMEHVAIGRRYARRIDEGIRRLPQMTSCAALSRAANTLGEKLLQEAVAAEREMDRQTAHGARQGATLQED